MSAGRRASSSSAGTGSASRPRWTVLLDQAEVERKECADQALRGQEEGVLLRKDRGMGAAGRRDVPWPPRRRNSAEVKEGKRCLWKKLVKSLRAPK